MQVDDPPYLSVGTAVSAKYKGAFCEAKVSKVVRIVKCKVTYKMGLGTATVSDEQIKGNLRVGHTVQAKHPEKKEFVEATVTKIQDCSQYTVVFDDGDITTLRRSALCLKSGRHFNESETLDQLPLTHPEHFGNPVMGGRRGRRNRQLGDDSSEGEIEEENEPDLEGYTTDIGRVVSVEATDKKRSRDNWFPGLVVIPSAQPTVRINVKDEYLVRSFKDGRYYTVPKKEVLDFNREMGEKVESAVLAEAVGKALKYLDINELPVHWERNSLFNMQQIDSESEENYSDTSDDEPNEEKDRFVAQLYKFMDDSGTPLNKSPIVANKDVDLHSLFRVVHKFGGYNRVTNQNKWKTIASRLKFPNNQITFNQLKSVYKKCLLSYESFYRTLGVTMLNHTRSTKKNRGRPLIRDKDRSTPVNTPKEEEPPLEIKKEEEKVVVEEKIIRKKEFEKKRKEPSETSDSNSSDATDQSESQPSTSRDVPKPKRIEKPPEKVKDKKPKAVIGIEKSKSSESIKKEEEDKQTQQTRSRVQTPKIKEIIGVTPKKKEVAKPVEVTVAKAPTPSKLNNKIEEEKKRGRKKLNPDDKPTVEIALDPCSGQSISIGDKLKVYYGPTHESKVTYEAKVIEIDKDPTGPVYLVHYTGWNTRYDEWITSNRIAENLSATTKAKRLKYGSNSGKQNAKLGAKRGRGMSITGRSTTTSEAPRSTTPSSVTSSSSRTKSPATPATRSSNRQRQEKKSRRASVQTDASNHSDTDSDLSETESEKSRTKSVTKSDDAELKTYKKRTPKSKADKTKSDGDIDKEEERPKRTRNAKKSPEKSNEDSDDETSSNPPKGRDFDLNQIISELKGFNKAIKAPTNVDNSEKEMLSSSDDSNLPSSTKLEQTEESQSVSKEEESPSSEDIYEFKEPEPFEFESRPKMLDEKSNKKRIPRLFEDLDSPKRKIAMSPEKEGSDSESKKFKKTPVRKLAMDSDEEDRKEDPFDKLVESPSFNVVKSLCKPLDKPKAVKNLLEEPFGSLFRELPESADTNSTDIDLSDSESQSQQTSRDEEVFSDAFSKSSPDRNTSDFISKNEDLKKEESDDFEAIRASINRAIEGDNTSDEDDLMITPSAASYQPKKKETDEATTSFEPIKVAEVMKDEVKDDSSNSQISPALQESDSSILKSICSQPIPEIDDVKDFVVKTGTKIADTLLQKFSSIQNKTDSDSEPEEKKDEEIEAETVKVEVKKTPPKIEAVPEVKKRRKVLSKAYIEESDSDSSDPEQLVIARSDDDSQTNSIDKDSKSFDESPGPSTSQEEERNFKFDKIDEKKKDVMETPKEEEPDSQLHSLLLCEETIPRSPAPQNENIGVVEAKPKVKSVHEMPFASAPGSSNNKNMLLNNEVKPVKAPAPPSAPNREAATVLDNTPPTTPESSISNLSPREDREELSPNTLENESCKSFDAEPEFTRKRRNSSINKPPLYSDDSQMTSESKKNREESTPGSCRKRRKSSRTNDDAPVKRGRRPLNRSRHNSDSDDNSNHSLSVSSTLGLSLYDRSSKSPRPSKYNFFVEFDPSLNSGQRIAVLQQKLSELRKTYAEVKTELAAVERRRKKIRRREREALKASKQEVVCG